MNLFYPCVRLVVPRCHKMNLGSMTGIFLFTLLLNQSVSGANRFPVANSYRGATVTTPAAPWASTSKAGTNAFIHPSFIDAGLNIAGGGIVNGASALPDTGNMTTTPTLSCPVFEIDQDFCSLDSGKVILTATDLSYASYRWSTGATSTSIVIQQSGIYSLTVTDITGCSSTKSVDVDGELLLNADFSLGRDVGYTTDYTWEPIYPQTATTYTINTDAHNTHWNFWGKDHTSRSGNFMIINGVGSTHDVWKTKVKVAPNTRYYFSAWAMSLNNVSPFGMLRFNIDGVNRGDTAVLPAGVENNSNSGWRRFYGQWTSPANVDDSITIKIVNLVQGEIGNDFGIDDISFSKLPPVKFFGAISVTGGNSMCEDGNLVLTAKLTGGQNPITYQWSGPNNFTSNADTAIIPPGEAASGWYYLTSTEGRNCQSRDSIFITMAGSTATAVRQGSYKCENAINIGVEGLVPGSMNNSIMYSISGTGAAAGNKVATGVNADTTGLGSFTISNLPYDYNGRTLTIDTVWNGGCKRKVNGVSLILDIRQSGDDNTSNWVGGPSGNWTDAYNWCGAPPNSNRNVLIPAGTTVYVSEGDSAICRDITLQGDALLKMSSAARLMLWGDINLSSTGKIDATEGIIQTMSNHNQNLPGNYFTGKSISTLILSNTGIAGKVTVTGDSLRILSALLFENNMAGLETNDKLVLASSDTATASLGIIPTNNTITGNFIVERYLINARKWRLISVPTNNPAQTVRNSWQESGVNIPGHGFIAADPRYTPSNTYGFDLLGYNSSVKKFNAITASWDAVGSTNLPINNEKGYMVFVAGDRSITFPGSNATKLRTAGTINRNNISYPGLTPGKFAVVGNPFPSRVDLRTITKLNIDDAVYVWDPSLGGMYGLGAFNTLYLEDGDYKNLLESTVYGPAGSVNNYIESGMAFMVKASTATGSITFKESDKTITTGSELASFIPSGRQAIRANLHLSSQGSSTAILLDGVMVNFGHGYSNDADQNDIKKLGTVGETVSWKTADSSLVIERRNSATGNDTLHLQLGLLKVQNYQWEITSENMDFPGRTAFLLDRHNNTQTALSMTGSTVVKFSVQNIPGSYAADRFKIVFQQQVVLPVNITSISASRNADKSIAVQWKVENEGMLQGYEVQRSNDGNDFATFNSQRPEHNAGGAVAYQATDTDIQSGDLFYRIKANSLGGQIQYSAIVKVAGIPSTPSISVYPNPVTGKQMQVRFNGMAAGTYLLKLINTGGQVVYTSSQRVAGSSMVKSVQLPTAVPAGLYELVVSSANGTISSLQVIVQ